MSDAVIRYGTTDWNLIRHVFLNGDLQPLVETINFTQGYIKRPYKGEPVNANQVKVPAGFIFDLVEDDWILETIHGSVTVAWMDKEAGKAWMRKHSD